MTSHWQKVGTYTRHKPVTPQNGLRGNTITMILIVTLFSPLLQAQLTPYQASYTLSNGSLDAKLNRSLSFSSNPESDDTWHVKNQMKIFLFSFEERAEFKLNNQHIAPLNYQYSNQLRSKRNSNLNFDWHKLQVTDPKQLNEPIALHDKLWDKLSFQEQLRLDLINTQGEFSGNTYSVVDTNRVKNYTVIKLGEETISTPAGTFNAVKLKQSRDNNNDEYSLIWLAKDWQYFIVRIDRIEEDEIDLQLQLENASLNGKPIEEL